MRAGYAVLGVFILCIVAGAYTAYWFGIRQPASRFRDVTTLTPNPMSEFSLSSKAFAANGSIPTEYTCDGEGLAPPLSWDNVPAGTKSFVLIVDDPDIPDSAKHSLGTDVFIHWIVYDIPPDATGTLEAAAPLGNEGLNSAGTSAYTPPCPPDGEHRYVFRLYALDIANLAVDSSPASSEQVLAAMEGQVLGVAELTGRYARSR